MAVIQTLIFHVIKVQRVLISGGIIHNANSSQEQLRKKSQLSVLWLESSQRVCNADAMLLPLSYRGS